MSSSKVSRPSNKLLMLSTSSTHHDPIGHPYFSTILAGQKAAPSLQPIGDGEGGRLIEGEAVTLSAAAGTGRRESGIPRPTASAVINTQKITSNTLIHLCFHHGSSGSRGVASYTVS
eukprot:scaffold70768_cov52-Cyclotella_meneghiniana.AAC.11